MRTITDEIRVGKHTLALRVLDFASLESARLTGRIDTDSPASRRDLFVDGHLIQLVLAIQCCALVGARVAIHMHGRLDQICWTKGRCHFLDAC